MRKGFFLLLGGACAFALLVTGCGGGSGNDSEVTASSLSKAQYIQKANAVCEKGTKQIATDFAVFLKEKESVKEPTEADYVQLFNTVVAPNVEREIDELRELGAPKGDEKEVEAILQAREESIQIAEEDPEAIIENSDKVFARASKVAAGYGLKTCATR